MIISGFELESTACGRGSSPSEELEGSIEVRGGEELLHRKPSNSQELDDIGNGSGGGGSGSSAVFVLNIVVVSFCRNSTFEVVVDCMRAELEKKRGVGASPICT